MAESKSAALPLGYAPIAAGFYPKPSWETMRASSANAWRLEIAAMLAQTALMTLRFPLRMPSTIALPTAAWRVLFALAAIVGLSNGAGAAPAASLECTVAGAAEPGFAEAFRRSLAEALGGDLAIAGPETAVKTGYAIVVAVTLETERSARVEIATSRLTDGIASDKRKSETNLVAHDGPLRAKSAATLAFPIVKQLFGK